MLRAINVNPEKMPIKRRRVELSTSSEESDDEMMTSGCVFGRRRFPNQVLRERRRRRLLVIRRLNRHRRTSQDSQGSGNNSTSSEGEQTEAERRQRLRGRRYKNYTLDTPAVGTQEQKNEKRWYHNICRDAAFAILSIFVLIVFLETHIETWITGRPPHRFSCYLCGIILCCALWCLLTFQDDIEYELMLHRN